MGISCGNFILLKEYAKRRELGKLLMYGRLFNTLSRIEQAKIGRHYGLPAGQLAEKYVENLLREIGATEVQSVDISDHEGCDIVLDLMEDILQNPDLAPHLCGRFDTILDFGTSEHIFNFPQTLVNSFNMLREGGRYIFDLPITGWTSHGLYQFSPNYFYSVGRSDYFELEHIFYHEKRGDRIYEIQYYNSYSYRRLRGRKRISCWGVFRKQMPAGFDGGLSLNHLRIMQTDVRGLTASAGRSLFRRTQSIRKHSIRNIAGAFDRSP